MSGPMFLTDCYDLTYLDPRLFSSRLSDEALSELWWPQMKQVTDNLVVLHEVRLNGWLRGTTPIPSFLTPSDTIYLPRFTQIIERYLENHPSTIGRKIRVMPIYEERGPREVYPIDRIYLTEIPVPRIDQAPSMHALSSVGEDIYSRLLEVAKRSLEVIIGDGAWRYKQKGEWTGVLSLSNIDPDYRELPAFYTAMVGDLVEEMLKEQANLELENVCCIGWDPRDTSYLTGHPLGYWDRPWIAYRIHPVPTIVS